MESTYTHTHAQQFGHIECSTNVGNQEMQHSPNATNTSSQAYFNKYLPVMWSALKNANTDKYLLTMRKLQIPSKQLYDSLKICILKYLTAIEPIAFVNASKLPNNSCGYMVLREHVAVLHMASTKAFRCLKSYKISTSITYANVTQVTYKSPVPTGSDQCMGCMSGFFSFLTVSLSLCNRLIFGLFLTFDHIFYPYQESTYNERPDTKSMYSKCLDELVNEAMSDFGALEPRLKDCLNEATPPDQSTPESTESTESNTDPSE